MVVTHCGKKDSWLAGGRTMGEAEPTLRVGTQGRSLQGGMCERVTSEVHATPQFGRMPARTHGGRPHGAKEIAPTQEP